MVKRPAEIEWFDAWGTSSYLDNLEDISPMKLSQIGYIVEENDDVLVLAISCNDKGRYRDVHIIPWVNVIKVEEIIYE